MKVPYLPLAILNGEEYCPGLSDTVLSTINSDSYILGRAVTKFESDFASYCGTKFCVGVGNGLDAISLALRAVGVGPGDEVIVPSMTFIATWLAVTQLGARAVPVDISPDDFNIDPNQLATRISKRTKAIVAVHLYGRPCRMDQLRDAIPKGIPIIEDAAQAHGATYNGKKAGNLGEMASFSFYPSKNLGALGDAGAITTSIPEFNEHTRLLRNYGSEEKYHHEVAGVNSRLDTIQASVLQLKLKQLDKWNETRSRLATRYLNEISNSAVRLPLASDDSVKPSWYVFPLLCENRPDFQEYLEQRGIGTIIHYPVPPHQSAVYRQSYSINNFPVANRVADQVISIPLHPALKESEQNYIIETINDFR